MSKFQEFWSKLHAEKHNGNHDSDYITNVNEFKFKKFINKLNFSIFKEGNYASYHTLRNDLLVRTLLLRNEDDPYIKTFQAQERPECKNLFLNKESDKDVIKLTGKVRMVVQKINYEL